MVWEGSIIRHQLIDNNGHFIDKDIIEEQFQIDIGFMEYISLGKAIPTEWKKKLREIPFTPDIETDINLCVTLGEEYIKLKSLKTKNIPIFGKSQNPHPNSCINMEWRVRCKHPKMGRQGIFTRQKLCSRYCYANWTCIANVPDCVAVKKSI